MNEVLSDGFAKQGVLGLIILALGVFIVWLMNGHKKERDEFRKDIIDWRNENRKELMDIADRSIEAQQENTSVLSSLKTLLETTREKK